MLPIILAGAALTAGYGAKKGKDAISNFKSAKKINKSAQKIYDDAYQNLEFAKLKARNSLESLGKLKFKLLKRSIIPFVETFQKIKNINYSDGNFIDQNLPSVNIDDMKLMEKKIYN